MLVSLLPPPSCSPRSWSTGFARINYARSLSSAADKGTDRPDNSSSQLPPTFAVASVHVVRNHNLDILPFSSAYFRPINQTLLPSAPLFPRTPPTASFRSSTCLSSNCPAAFHVLILILFGAMLNASTPNCWKAQLVWFLSIPPRCTNPTY